MRPMIRPPEDAVREQVESRTLTGKCFVCRDGRIKWVSALTPVHVPRDPRSPERDLSDIDTDVLELEDRFCPTNTWYHCDINRGRIAWSYLSKRQGDARLSLVMVDGRPITDFTLNLNPRCQNNQIIYENILPDLDFIFEFHPYGVYLYKRLKTINAPGSFTWEIDYTDDNDFAINMATSGKDNEWNIEPRRKRRLEILHDVMTLEQANGRTRVHFTEQITGRSYARDTEGRLVVQGQSAYPFYIDQDIIENIINTLDDGYEGTGTAWYFNLNGIFFGLYGAYSYYPGFRFPNLQIGQGQSILNATLTATQSSVYGAGTTMDVYGYDVDDAPQFGNPTPRPSSAPKTTASGSVVLTSTGAKNIDVTAIVQELVNRAGWTPGNAINFFLVNPTGVAPAGGYLYDVNDPVGPEAQLTITFSPVASMQRLEAQGSRTRRIRWANLAADGVGAHTIVGETADMTVQVTGTFDGATLSFQGSNDGLDWITLTDAFGNALDFTTAGLRSVLPRCLCVRPMITGGTSTDLTVDLLMGS